jgi:hypothetical protein
MPQDLNAPTPRREPVCGYVYKGLPKAFQGGKEVAGADLGARGFRVRCHEPALHQTIQESYGGQILPNNEGVVVPFLRIYLPAETLAGNLDAFYGQATQGGGYTLKCSGQKILSRKIKHTIDPAKAIAASGMKGVRSRKPGPYDIWETIKPKDEPCPWADLPDCPVCTPVRQLKFYICELWHKHQRQVHILNSHAKSDGLLAQTMAALEGQLLVQGANLSTLPPTLAHIPETQNYVRYILKRIPQTVHKVGFGKSAGKQIRVIEHLLHLEIDPEWEEVVKARWGMGPFKINPETGQAESLMAFYQRHYDVLALQGGGTPLALPVSPQPALASAPIEVDAEIVPIEEAMGLDVFLPRDISNTQTSARISMVGRFLGLPGNAAMAAMRECWPGRHSSEINPRQALLVIDVLLAQWALCQTYPNGDPLFETLEEARSELAGMPLPIADRERAQAWTTAITARLQENRPSSGGLGADGA